MSNRICKHCGCYDDEHNYEHLARECYPKQIEALTEKLDSAQSTNQVEQKVSWHQYVMSCFNCGIQENLCMFAHRNKNGNMVGWIFSCERCESVICGNELDIKLSS